MKCFLPEGYLYTRYPKEHYHAATLIALQPYQAVLLRAETGKEILFSIQGDYELGKLLSQENRKIACEIEFLSLAPHTVSWGKSFALWDGSSVGMNGTLTLCPDTVRSATGKPSAFAARCRSLCGEGAPLKPADGYAAFTRDAVDALSHLAQSFAKQSAYDSEALIRQQSELLTEINRQLPLALDNGVVIVNPFMINGMIVPAQ